MPNNISKRSNNFGKRPNIIGKSSNNDYPLP